MNGFIIKSIFFFLLLLVVSSNLHSQNKKELQDKKKQLQQEINYTNKLLQETEKNKKTTINQLNQLIKKISSREALVLAMGQEISLINDSISSQEKHIKKLEDELEILKDEYAILIVNANRNRSGYDRMMFLFSAEDFNQAFKRLKYMKQYAKYRQEQAMEIEKTKKSIDEQIRGLEAIRESKKGLLKAQLNEKSMLAQEKEKQENVVGELQGKEKELKQQLTEKKKAQEKLEKAIERIIEEEIRRAKAAATKAGKDAKGFPLTPEAQKLSDSFTANKGKLPWPVKEGVITSQYGEHPHPVLAGVKVQNNGIDITTSKSASGRAVFDGVVSGVLIIPGEGKGVMIRHGEYLTVYTYFKEVFVTKGDKVTTKQDIGILVDEDSEFSAIMHLEVWKSTTKLNPEEWIFKK